MDSQWLVRPNYISPAVYYMANSTQHFTVLEKNFLE